jgi:3-hydroxyisobutyrate dehydrogenase-like beta-hydroxyacid dehydrogenase
MADNSEQLGTKEVNMNPPSVRRIALIGFGEVGAIFGSDFAASGLDVRVFDILLRDEPSREAMLANASHAKVHACDSVSAAVQDADLVISAVTASAAIDAAKEAAPALCRGHIFLDINSVSPQTKREIARVIEPSSASFVEAAVMAPVGPQRLRVPMLLGGTDAPEAANLLRLIGMNATPVSDRIGVASAIKMCRSIIIKGLESLVVESLFAARSHGAEDAVLASLAASYPQMGWTDRLPDYLVSRVAEHGRRRAAEMREAAQTLKGVGFDPWMALATAERQDWLVNEMAQRDLAYRADEPFSWRALADSILSR